MVDVVAVDIPVVVRIPVVFFCPQIPNLHNTSAVVLLFCCPLQSFLDVPSSLAPRSSAAPGFVYARSIDHCQGLPYYRPYLHDSDATSFGDSINERPLCTVKFCVIVQPRSIATSPAQIHRTSTQHAFPRARNTTRKWIIIALPPEAFG